MKSLNQRVNAPLDTISTDDRKIIDFKKLGLKTALILGKHNYTRVKEELQPHLHKNIMEICYCDKGEQVYYVDGQLYTVAGGEVFITFPNELHSTGGYPEDKGVLFWLAVKIPAEKNSFFDYSAKDANLFIQTLMNLPSRHFKGTPKMKKNLEKIFQLFEDKKNKLQKIVLTNLLISFLIDVIESATHAVKKQRQLSSKGIEVQQLIEKKLREVITLEFLAKSQFLSISRFKSWFKEEFGVPPLEYILRKKIEESKKIMLEQPKLSVSDIAFELDFSTPQYFATVFKRFTSHSPAQYRSTLKNLDKEGDYTY